MEDQFRIDEFRRSVPWLDDLDFDFDTSYYPRKKKVRGRSIASLFSLLTLLSYCINFRFYFTSFTYRHIYTLHVCIRT